MTTKESNHHVFSRPSIHRKIDRTRHPDGEYSWKDSIDDQRQLSCTQISLWTNRSHNRVSPHLSSLSTIIKCCSTSVLKIPNSESVIVEPAPLLALDDIAEIIEPNNHHQESVAATFNSNLINLLRVKDHLFKIRSLSDKAWYFAIYSTTSPRMIRSAQQHLDKVYKIM